MATELNSIKLSPALTASLFRHSLIDTGEQKTVDEIKPVTTQPVVSDTIEGNEWKYLGGNKQQILIVVNNTGITHLPDEDLELLTSILKACKLDLGDVAIINSNNYPQHTYKEYIAQFKSRIVLLFGLDPVGFGLPMDFPHFQIQSFSKTTFLHSPPLGEYDKLLKSKLWVCLKTIFGL
jgi:hypothetical protein